MTDSRPTEDSKQDESGSISHCMSPDRWLHWLRNDDECVGKELARRRRWTWINVYAIYEDEDGCGAYGVVLRNALAKPLVASAKFSENGLSFFHQAFMGIKAGIELAERRKLSDLHVQCNSCTLPVLFRDIGRCSNKECLEKRDPLSICRSCEAFFSRFANLDMMVISLGMEIRGNGKIVGYGSSWGGNMAARYLANHEMNKRHQVKKNEERVAPDDDVDEMEAVDFPQELRNIIWKDALPEFYRDMGSAGQED